MKALNRLNVRAIAPIALGVFAFVLVACSSSTTAVEPTAQPAAPAPVVVEATATPFPPTPAPEATATAEPSPEPVATATPEPEKDSTPLSSTAGSSSSAVNGAVARLGSDALEFLTTFTEDVSPRASGTEQERAAAEFLANEFKSLGYDVQLQSFMVETLSPEAMTLTLDSPEARDIQAIPMSLSGMGAESGVLVDVGRAFEEDIPADGLEGKIAFIERGVISFEEKVSRVADAGVIGAVVFNNAEGLFRGQLSNQATIPVIGISQEDGEDIIRLMRNGDVEVTVTVEIVQLDSQNVIAEKRGTGDGDKVVVLGGHYDTVPNTLGANDNGSGIAVMVSIAKAIADRSYPFTVRFIGFGSEELGLRGSQFYVSSLTEDEVDDTLAMLNFDALATGDVVGLLGEFAFIDDLKDYAEANGIDAAQRFSIRGSTSDHASFQLVGIPVVFFLADDFSRIHTPEDTLEFVQSELLGGSAALGIALLDMIAEG